MALKINVNNQFLKKWIYLIRSKKYINLWNYVELGRFLRNWIY